MSLDTPNLDDLRQQRLPTATTVRPWHTGLTRRSTATLLRLSGYLDVLISSELRQLLAHALGKSPNVIVHLGEVQLIDSIALGALLGARNHALTEGGDLCLVAPTRAVRKLLTTARLDTHFPTFDTTDEAEQWCRHRRRTMTAEIP